MSNIRLSNSSSNLFQECPTKWKLHYMDKLRGQTTSGALLFGSALDAAISHMLLQNDGNEVKVFEAKWERGYINGVETLIPPSPLVVYAESDLDEELITSEQWEILNGLYPAIKEDLPHILSSKKEVGYDNLRWEDKVLLNQVNWYSLLEKGKLMIECFKKNISPNIEKVLAVQTQVDLDNGNGDGIIGYVDMVLKYKGYEKPIIFDLKTSTRQYEENAVQTSPQLILYVHGLSDKYENTDLAGFLVLHKTIRKNRNKICSVCKFDGSGARHKTCSSEATGKRCGGEWVETITPEATYQVLIDKVTEYKQDMVMENYDVMTQAIKTGHFYKNLSNCIKPYGKCIFYKKCHEGKDDDLIVVEDTRKK